MDAKRRDLLRLLAATQATASELQEDILSDPAFRGQVIEASKNLTRTLQTPVERAWDLFVQPTYPAVLQVAVDVGWLNLINSIDDKNGYETGISAEQLAEATTSDVGLVRRLMRVLTSGALIRESGTHRYAATPISKLFDNPAWANGLRHAVRDYGVTLAGMPEYLEKNGYRLEGASGGIYQHVHGIPFLERVHQGGEVGKQFTSFMSVVRAGKTPWFDVYPVASNLQVSSATDVLIVDIGGSKGHDLLSFAHIKKSLGLPGRLVLQDLAPVLSHVPGSSTDTIEVQAHDFFTPQPVLGARAYFLKHVLHDWPDRDCVSILGRVRDAMKAGYSRLLINEIVLPDRECGAWPAAFDVTMMAIVGGMERSASEWEVLIESAGGLAIEKVWTFGADGESIVEVVKEVEG
ncbi:hypothetical protein N0V90_004720 [Kalmusia sp. IMI 367209]|nr:hypothetical protein N0V90_004720 [Kalmusia sp. IMI 367209]